jgi:hypothetical protein
MKTSVDAAMDIAIELLIKTGTRRPWGDWAVALFEDPGGIRGRVVPREDVRAIVASPTMDSQYGKDPSLLLVVKVSHSGKVTALFILPVLHNAPGGLA